MDCPEPRRLGYRSIRQARGRISALVDCCKDVAIEDNQWHPGLHRVSVVSCCDHRGKLQRWHDKETLAPRSLALPPN
jgi:hypothetical protein